MKMNIKILILTSMITAKAVADTPCPGDRPVPACCGISVGMVNFICTGSSGYYQNIPDFEKKCHEEGLKAQCCQRFIPPVGLMLATNCTDP
ncbi:hypothetical protein HDV62DRAFT_366022 [Trichoderma sp. SZMC 28011]